MKKELKIFISPLLFLLILFLTSCEDDVTLEFQEYTPKIVVEGSIPQNEFARVILTRSTGYFDTIDQLETIIVDLGGFPVEVPKFLYDMVITDAKVAVSDGIITDSLQLSFNPDVFPYISYTGSIIKGEVGKDYFLTIEAEGQILSAQTSIPEPVPFDSLWFEPLSSAHDTLGYIHGSFNEPPETGNYYRIITKSPGRDSTFVHPWNSVFPDRNINGEEDVEFAVYHGDNKLEDPEDHTRWYFKTGEKVILRFCSIDFASYRFWYTYSQNAGGGGNPFAAPAQIESNITNGLGVWEGYSYTDSLYVCKNNDTLRLNNSKKIVLR